MATCSGSGGRGEEKGLVRGTNEGATIMDSCRLVHRHRFYAGMGSIVSGECDTPPLTYMMACNYRRGITSDRRVGNVLTRVNCNFARRHAGTRLVVFGAYTIHRRTRSEIFNGINVLGSCGLRGPNVVVTYYNYVVRRGRVTSGVGGDCPFISLIFNARIICGLPRLLFRTLAHGGEIFRLPSASKTVTRNIPILESGSGGT